jgi:hypothetical protein
VVTFWRGTVPSDSQRSNRGAGTTSVAFNCWHFSSTSSLPESLNVFIGTRFPGNEPKFAQDEIPRHVDNYSRGLIAKITAF